MKKLNHKFVEFIPEVLDDGILYVSVVHGTAVHRCCCECGREVVTPLTPTDWKLIFDGETVSLYPSIGNWNFPCRSHYWITRNRVEWAEDWSDWRIAEAEEKDLRQKKKFYDSLEAEGSAGIDDEKAKTRKGIWSRFWKHL
ncbi:MAG TPA: hypothetical protein DDZ88_26610 [Verrucomicrobiales bacterium]|nr:hypothetical protein [Verrucomicrobiales bacterium]